AKPGEFSAWSDAMFGGMPYNSGYGDPAPKLPGFDLLEQPIKKIGYMNAGMVFASLISFYLLMCVLGVKRWPAIAGSVAFAFASYNIIIIAVGHITKAYVIAYMPVVIAGMLLLFKRKYLWGSILFLLGTALSIFNYHIQITYYLLLLCVFIYIGYLIGKIKEGDWKELGKVTAIMVACAIIAVLPSARSLYTQWDLGKTSLRGATELTTVAQDGEKISSGLDKDYAFQWSYGKGELLTFLIPNVYGGSSNETLDSSSKFYKALRAAGYREKTIQAPTYWGDKSFTSGPVYFGAVVCFLFLLGMFVLKNRIKWWLFAGAVFLILLALGRNLDWFNSFIFHYFPFYNKFRTPEMALVIPGLVFPIIAFWGLKDIIEEKPDKNLLTKGLIWSLSITGGICLIIWWFPQLFFNFQSSYDTILQYDKQSWYDDLVQDRVHLASFDAFRSLIFVLLSAALVFVFIRIKNKKQGVLLLGIGFTVLTLVDLWPIDKRYLNDKNFAKEKLDASYKESVADKEILKDKDLSYRVLTLQNPFQETTVSYYHHSIGGYSPAKLRRYQELIDHRLSKEIGIIIQSFQKEQVTLADIQQAFVSIPSLNMLNTRYIIYNPAQPPIVNPQAFGNAWFVPQVKIAENADAEIAALDTINPLQTAVVDKRFTDDLKGFVSSQPDSAASIVLDNYRPNHLIYTSKTNSEQLAVFSEIYYPNGWKAAIDGQPAPHFRADWTLRAMLVPAGEHRIEFDFRPEGYVKAAYVSSVSSFVILLLLIAGIAYSIWKEVKPKLSSRA
ncbi:MAG: hypothetical protein FWF53_07565, partial [Candidatus Azobacteroides sp.]|nr:hypothetical protein [Candidatus Azobacteroides sp.]